MSAYYAQLEQEALVHITGPDTLTFLQGQTTCDTRSISASEAAAGAYCTPKGRMVCDFLLGQLGEEHYALRMRASVTAAAAGTLGKYIVFSKADLDSDRSDWQVFALWGDEIASALAQTTLQLPQGRYQASSGDGYTLIQVDEAGRFFELWLAQTSQAELLPMLEQALEPGAADDWASAQIRAGIGRVEGATSEEFLPQDLNYDITGHVNFTKGCYTGQEIVARLHYRGKAKRRAYPVALDGSDVPAAGTPVYVSDGKQSVGAVVNSARSGEGIDCLVSTTRDGLTQGLHLGNSEGPSLSPLEQPYPLDE